VILGLAKERPEVLRAAADYLDHHRTKGLTLEPCAACGKLNAQYLK
jgi:hypothetical protein